MNVLFRELRQEFFIEDTVLFVDQFVRAGADGLELLHRDYLVRAALQGAERDLLFKSGHTDFEELVQSATRDAQELHPFQQRIRFVHRLGEHAPVELELAQFPVDVKLGVSNLNRFVSISSGSLDRRCAGTR